MNGGIERLFCELPGCCTPGDPPRVRPQTAAQAAQALAIARAENLSVRIEGRGLRAGWGNPVRADWVLDTTGLVGEIDHAPADMVVTAPAAMTLAELNERLARYHQVLPLEVPHPARTTLGGLVAADPASLSWSGHGQVRDWLIGLEVATPDAERLRLGARVVKSVAGYDLCKLFTGSLGTLGAILTVTFKVRPRWEATGLLRLSVGDPAAWPRVLEALQTLPVDPALAAFEHPGAFWVGFDGPAAMVADQLDRLQRSGLAERMETWAGDEARARRAELADRFGSAGSQGWTLRLAVWPEQVLSVGPELGLPMAGMRALIQQGVAWFEAEHTLPAAAIARWRARLAEHGGALVVEHAPRHAEIDRIGVSAGVARLMNAIRRELDPAGLLAPGRWATEPVVP